MLPKRAAATARISPGTDLSGLREQRVGELRRKVHGFVNEVLSTET